MSTSIQSHNSTSSYQIQSPITPTKSQNHAPITLSDPIQITPIRNNTLPPSYKSLPNSSIKSFNPTINRQEEKQALRDARTQIEEEIENNRGNLPSGQIEPESNNSSSGSASGSGGNAVPSSGIDNNDNGKIDGNINNHNQPNGSSLDEENNQNDASQEENNLEIGYRGYLPPGLDVRDALAKCEDPTLGWSLQFWVTIADPLTQHVFFACPASGQCSWDPPVGAFVVPRSPDGEWWELADSTRGNRSYYYNTLTGKTQWTRPGGNAFVIPLGLIQAAALPTRPQPQSPSNPSSSRIVSTTPSRSNRQNRSSGLFSPNSLQTPNSAGRSNSYPQLLHSPLKSIPRPIHSPSKSIRSSSLTPSSSVETNFGNANEPSQTLEAIVMGHFASPSSYTSNINGNENQSHPLIREGISGGSRESEQTHSTSNSMSSNPATSSHLSVVEEGSGNETDMSDFTATGSAGGGWWEKRKSQVLTVKTGFKSPGRKFKGLSLSDNGSPIDGMNSSAARGSPLKKSRTAITGPIYESNESTAESLVSETPTELTVLNGINGTSGCFTPGLTRNNMPEGPIYVDNVGTVKTKRLSTGLHPLLPFEISSEILAIQTDDFARKYFATKRSGIMRQKVPVEVIINHQKSPINQPLLVLSKNLNKDAIITFKVIQHVMGEREKPVEGAKPFMSSSSHLNLASLALGGRKGDLGHPDRNGKLANGFGNLSGNGNGNSENGQSYDGNISDKNWSGNGNGGEKKSDKIQVLEEIRWLIQLCVASSEMRDEVYCQLIKQLTKNPNHDAVVLGFQLFCVLVNAFGPSKNFEPFVKNFLRSTSDEKADGIGIMSKYCIGKLDVLTAKGGRGKALTIGEIEHASDAAFYPSVYGESLDRIMELQKRAYPDLKVPVILPFLADGILALGGLESEGIFRVPGDADSINELKSRMDRGHYQLKGINDPHVASSLFKLWLRELEDPIIPFSLYNDALQASKSIENSINFLNKLPLYNKRVLLFVINFLQLFINKEIIKKTKMTSGNLALVMAPNILRTTSNSLITVFTNSNFETKFILQLLENLNPKLIDEEYIPEHGKPIGKI
ncbi:uncharacterized protein I206_106485 [Kwoniella pini CBS 10737]|uniref:Rho GTPase activator n=1 Tax=Kwoniella pini CBS 10737 TaxID=1296096 RepID=A0A1B9HUG4_9TREE|nr:uncharacterized protein I206_07290 [Kwoniella pini CBS 10737]OCF46903.1 hypothetical protein I206_07290 [Kwoniella pini CBS 10737]